jgi:two-component system phosphate regulon response regulator OmpR
MTMAETTETTDAEAPHILVVDDDSRLRELLRKYLSENGFRVTAAADAAAARRQMQSIAFDLIVLDRMMPGEDGLDLARSLRQGDDVPILMLTAMGEVEARIDGLEVGVDDYLPKPFEPRELVLRIRTVLRRSGRDGTTPPPTTLRLGNLELDLERGLLLQGNTIVQLTTTEVGLLAALGRNPGRVLSRDELTRRCRVDGGERAIDVQVARLRRKIEPDPKAPRYLQTVRGRGYVLRPD